MKINKCGFALIIVSLILFTLFLSVDKNGRKEWSGEMTLQVGKKTIDIRSDDSGRQDKTESTGSDTMDGQKVTENTEAAIITDHSFSGSMWGGTLQMKRFLL